MRQALEGGEKEKGESGATQPHAQYHASGPPPLGVMSTFPGKCRFRHAFSEHRQAVKVAIEYSVGNM